MVVRVKVTTDINRFAKNLRDWDRTVRGAERRCLTEKMLERGLKATRAEAHRALKGRTSEGEIRSIVRADTSGTQQRDARGRFTSATGAVYVNVTRRNRTSQVLAMMYTGGRVKIGTRRMRAMTIDEKYNVPTIRSIIKATLANGRLIRSSGGVKTYYSPKQGNRNYTVVVSSRGTRVFERTGKYWRARRKTGTYGGNRSSELIAYLPKKANYERDQFRFDDAFFREINTHFRLDSEECFKRFTVRSLKKGIKKV